MEIPSPARGDVELETLSRYECWQLVTEAAAADGIARVVWANNAAPAIVPVNFTVADGAFWFQTRPDSRLANETCFREVLVEVDEVDPATHTGWSVIATGVGEYLSPADDPGILGDLVVWPPGRNQLLIKVQPDELSGRRLRRR